MVWRQALVASCTPCPGVPGSAFRGVCSTCSAFACGKLGCPLLKLAPGIILCVLANLILPTQAWGSPRKIKCLCHSIPVHLSASNEIWVCFQGIHGGGESILLEARPPYLGSCRKRYWSKLGKWGLGTWSSSFSPWLLSWEGESVMCNSEVRIKLSWSYFWRSRSCCLDTN